MKPVEHFEIQLYQSDVGRCPFLEWFNAIHEEVTRDRIDARLARLRLGNLGDYRDLGDGLRELRLFFGLGYRIYFTQRGQHLVVLLVGGTKGTQRQDIRKAREFLRDLEERER